MQRLNLVALAAMAIAAAVALLPATAAANSATPHYYLALGDSLSQGMQPDLHGATRNTTQGYANDLLKIEQGRIPNLKLVQLGCGGDTTTSMLTGRGNTKNARLLHCDRAGGSQVSAAVRFLKAHHNKGEVPLITVDIGANDVDGCVTASNLIQCVTNGLDSIGKNVPKIFASLKKAAPAGTTFAAMNLYDPILGGYFGPAGTSAHLLATASVTLAKEVNGALAKADNRGGFLTADVADAFDTYNGTTMVKWEDQQIPLNVANVCSWTWACQTPPSGPNIHPNKNGYQVIANAFAKVIGNRLSR
ncbi:MAG: SGNH/GDSL hydrolase family protein [Solirubrobacteraceae bacterium]